MSRRRGAAAPPAIAVASADSHRRLSEGTLVQGSIRARLLGIPLLRLEATLALLPAGVPSRRSAVPAGDGLPEAVRSLNDGAEILAELRRNGRR